MTTTNHPNPDEVNSIAEAIGLPESTTLPANSTVLLSYSRDEMELQPEDRHYTLKGVLTPSGWVPPAPRAIAHLIGQAGTSPHDLSVVDEYAAGKATRLTISVETVDQLLAGGASIEVHENSWSLLGSPYQDATRYYIPEGLTDEEEGTYLHNTALAAHEYAQSQHTENPSEQDIIGILTEEYDTETEAARIAVGLINTE